MRCARRRTGGAFAGPPVVSGRPVRARNGRPVRHQSRRASPAAPTRAPRPLARGLVSRCAATPAPAPEFERPGHFPFVTVEGPGVYEIPVGPVHAGLIEPGHFRFSVVGETVLKLKARLWFVHRGVEKLFEGRPADGARRAGRTHQRRHLRRTRARPQPRRRRRARHRPPRRRPPAARPARRTRTALQPRHRPGRAGQRRRIRTGQRARPAHPRSNCCGSTPPSPGTGCCAAPSARAGSRCEHCPTPTELRSRCSRRRRDRRTDPAQQRHPRPVRRHRHAAPGRRHALGCLGYVARASGMRTDARLDHPTTELPVAESPPPPATCWPATPCAATNSPPPPSWPAT